MTLSLAQLLTAESKTAIYNKAIEVAQTLDLPVTSWQPGDPTRSYYHVVAEILSTLEDVVVLFVGAGFLDEAAGDWATLAAYQLFGVERVDATYATTDVVLTNNGGGYYPDIVAGDLTFKSSTTGKTYRNTTGGTLASGPATTLTVTVVADEAGSDSSAGATEIDELVTGLLDVTCSNATAAVGIDAESDASLRQRCRDKLGALSPDGPPDAYAYVARNSDLTGTSAVTRVRVFPDSDTGDVVVYLAGPAGAIGAPDVTLVEAAILEWATPLCITPTVASAANVVVPVTYQLWLYRSVGDDDATVQDTVEAALSTMFAARPIGGDIISPPAATGYLYRSMVESTIRAAYPNHAFRVSVAAPAADLALTNNQVATLGTITPTITRVDDP